MAKVKLPSYNELQKYLHKDKLLPVYFFCGDDDYGINQAVGQVIKIAEPLIQSDFDKETFSLEKGQNLSQLLDVALAFPFGGGKKVIVIKNFEKLNDKKEFINYISNAPDFTILIVTHLGKISDASREPFASLLKKNFLFEFNSETGDDLVDWLIRKAKEMGVSFSDDGARLLIEIVGGDKSLLEMQIDKFIDFAADKRDISDEDIRKIASPTKNYSIFDLQDAIGIGNKTKALEIAYNLLDGGVDIIVIISMIAKFIITIAQIMELARLNINDNEAAKKINVSWYYYINCKKAKFLLSDERLLNSSRALMNADVSVKTTSMDSKTVLTILISEIMMLN